MPDDALRRQAAEAVAAGCGLLVAVPSGGVAFVAAHALGNLDCAPGWWSVPTVALGLLVPAMGALAAWCATVLVLPARAGVPAAVGRGPAAR
ncbi:hypothetical protein [Blastococcus brunescens]|uniref:Uncharacterized protein n=1 Tax=Blastococcus brunescens TaxID=1564165 RepID=A0ABZ1AYI9_9ACTN|nr:hypothetical protein [Blastococcus sp. BMG 8361]WRL62536.1 hypothetical protein U6N30_21450 [Blastococcus sp. BMG 8361]